MRENQMEVRQMWRKNRHFSAIQSIAEVLKFFFVIRIYCNMLKFGKIEYCKSVLYFFLPKKSFCCVLVSYTLHRDRT